MSVVLVLVLLIAFVVILTGFATKGLHQSRTWAEPEVGIHNARRRIELWQLRFAVRRDAQRIRREIDDELL